MDEKISQLDNYTPPADTDVFPIVDVANGITKKITFANLKSEIVGDDTAFVRKADYDANSILYATADNTPLALTVATNSVVGRVGGNITTLAVDSDLSSVSASDDTVPSAKATKTALDLKANDADVVHDTGNETVAGIKTFTSDPIIPDEAYGSGWNGVLEPPTKNAVYDKIESLTSLSIDEVVGTATGSRTYWTSQLHIDADLGWNISTTTTEARANGLLLDGNTTTTAYNTLKGDSNSTSDINWSDGIDFKLFYWFIPINTSDANTTYFHGFSDGGSAQQCGDITNTSERRVGFIHNGGKIYTATCGGSAITTTEVDATDDGTVKKVYGISFTPSSVIFYINGSAVATHSTNIPSNSNTMRISYLGYDGGGGSSGFLVSHPTLSETLS